MVDRIQDPAMKAAMLQAKQVLLNLVSCVPIGAISWS